MNFNSNNIDCYFNNGSLNNSNYSNLLTSLEDLISLKKTHKLNSSFGIKISVPEWEAIISIIILFAVIIGTIFGNILVILGVFTYKPLRIVQNFFIVSLAVADLAVAILVMPLNVAYMILGKWHWGKQLCKMWLTCDIMSCTSSILNLCAIALDRYWAITEPINYARKRTLKRVIYQIVLVWSLSSIISSPPLFGWNDWDEKFTADTPCQLTSEPGFVVYSSLGSFFIPLIIMAIVYLKIYIAMKKRLRKRALITRMENKKPVVMIGKQGQEYRDESENDSDSGDNNIKCRKRQTFVDMRRQFFMPLLLLNDPVSRLAIEMNLREEKPPLNCCTNYNQNTAQSLKQINHNNKKKMLLSSVKRSGDIVSQFAEQKQKISLLKERRAARTLGVIVGVFVLCWLPFFVMYLILPFCSTCCPSMRVKNFITWLGYANSAVNPLIYTIFNIEFRKAFKKLLGVSC